MPGRQRTLSRTEEATLLATVSVAERAVIRAGTKSRKARPPRPLDYHDPMSGRQDWMWEYIEFLDAFKIGGAEFHDVLRRQIVADNADHAGCACQWRDVAFCPRHRNRDKREVLVGLVQVGPWIERRDASAHMLAIYERVMEAWPKLTDRQRDAIEARVAFAGNDSEAARFLGVDESTFSEHIRAGRKKIDAAIAANTPESRH